MSKNTVEDFRKTISIKNFKENWFLDWDYKKWKTTWYYADKEIWSMGIEIVKNNFSWYLRVYFIQTDET